MIFPGFPGVLSFFQVFQVEWEPWGGPHPTGMLSCSSIFYNLQLRNPCNLSDRTDIRVRVGDLGLLCLDPI